MSHVDDGQLHAWLDGALDDYPEEEAARVRAHLERCEACAARLEEARAVQAGSEAVLAEALPEPGALPELESLRAEARRREGGRKPGRALTRLAWAASVVVSLGVGWMAGELTAPGTTGPFSAPEDPAASPPATPSAAANGREAEEDPSPRLEAEAPRQEVADAEEDRAAGAGGPPPPAAEERLGDRSVALDAVVVTGAPAREEGAVESALDAPRPAPSPTRSLGLPGLEVLSVARLPDIPRGTGIRIDHRLPQGDTLQVFHLLGGADPSALPLLDPGWTELTLPDQGGWTVLRGRGTPEELREWAEGLPR